MNVAATTRGERPFAILVDDDASVREALGELLDSVGIESIAFSSAHEMLETDLPDRPSCIILDVRMPGLSGIDLQQQLASSGISTPIVFLTGHADVAMSVQAMKSGAVDFLAKPVRDQSILDAVTTAIDTDISRRAAETVSRRNLALYKTLTPRERQVLKAVVAGAMNKQIAFDLDIAEVTVKLHRSGMMKKMRAASIADLLNAWQSLPPDIRLNGSD